MAKVALYNMEGTKTGDMEVSDAIFAAIFTPRTTGSISKDLHLLRIGVLSTAIIMYLLIIRLFFSLVDDIRYVELELRL